MYHVTDHVTDHERASERAFVHTSTSITTRARAHTHAARGGLLRPSRPRRRRVPRQQLLPGRRRRPDGVPGQHPVAAWLCGACRLHARPRILRCTRRAGDGVSDGELLPCGVADADAVPSQHRQPRYVSFV